MKKKFVEWLIVKAGWKLVPGKEEKLDCFETKLGWQMFIDGVTPDNDLYSLLLLRAAEGCESGNMSKSYVIDTKYSHLIDLWDSSVFLNGQEIMVTASTDKPEHCKMLALQAIYDRES